MIWMAHQLGHKASDSGVEAVFGGASYIDRHPDPRWLRHWRSTSWMLIFSR